MDNRLAVIPARSEGGVRQRTPSGKSVLLVSVADAARMLGIGKTLCWELIWSGDLKSVPIGRRRLVPVHSIHEYVDRLMGEAD